MSTYTVEQLSMEGPQFAMAMLLECIKKGEPFVTYGDIRTELEFQLKIDRIFPVQIGHVAGTLMNQILEIDPKAPLINVLITRPNGIPSIGVADYVARRYKNNKLRDWNNVTRQKKIEIVERERKLIFNYPRWEEINKQLYGTGVKKKLRAKSGTEHDYSGHHGGTGESKEHKKLKEWVAKNPKGIGLRKSFGKGAVESSLLSGDVVDVMFSDGDSFRMVEVKSCRSNDEDLRRGIYQCIKYREVKKAEHLPYGIDVQSILVTERELNPELKERAKLLGIKHKCFSVNKK